MRPENLQKIIGHADYSTTADIYIHKDIAELQRLRLCDTLTVQYTKLGIRNTAKIVKTVYNVLLERYDSLTIGETKENLRG